MRSEVDAVVVGAGFAGIYQAHLLRALGLTVRVLETGDQIGGTWHWNRYPGARCDIESIDYSYSFSEEIEQEWEWSERYAAQPEILAYINHVVDKLELRSMIELETTVETMTWDKDEHRWTIGTSRGEQILARFAVMATGCLSVPREPELPGLEKFRGETLHTGRWPIDPVDFSGLKVAVVGTGSSAIQCIPQVARQAAEVTVFQRTPSFATTAVNRPIAAEEWPQIRATYRDRRAKARSSWFGLPIDKRPRQSAFDVSDQERHQLYEEAWAQGSLLAVLNTFNDLMADAAANQTAADFIRSKIRETVSDPDTAERLMPQGYPYGSKRPCLEVGYFEAFNRPNASLVDVKEHPLVAVTEKGLATAEKEYEFDKIVFATGFDAMTGALAAIDIRGLNDVTLRQHWLDGPRTYLGMTSAGFPNMFFITGPGSPSVLSNVLQSIEQNAEWIADLIDHVRESEVRSVHVTSEAEETWGEHVREVAEKTLFPVGSSWYLGANVPGKPRVFMPYVGGFSRYVRACTTEAVDAYPSFAMEA